MASLLVQLQIVASIESRVADVAVKSPETKETILFISGTQSYFRVVNFEAGKVSKASFYDLII